MSTLAARLAAVNFSQYKHKGDAARRLHKELVAECEAQGMNPDIEIFIDTPQKSQNRGYGKNWRVCWESGPHAWAIECSFAVRGAGCFTEPYYGFDLCFAE